MRFFHFRSIQFPFLMRTVPKSSVSQWNKFCVLIMDTPCPETTICGWFQEFCSTLSSLSFPFTESPSGLAVSSQKPQPLWYGTVPHHQIQVSSLPWSRIQQDVPKTSPQKHLQKSEEMEFTLASQIANYLPGRLIWNL